MGVTRGVRTDELSDKGMTQRGGDDGGMTEREEGDPFRIGLCHNAKAMNCNMFDSNC